VTARQRAEGLSVFMANIGVEEVNAIAGAIAAAEQAAEARGRASEREECAQLCEVLLVSDVTARRPAYANAAEAIRSRPEPAGIARIFGQWPGDETDEEVEAAMMACDRRSK
jgi:hypothetical protein